MIEGRRAVRYHIGIKFSYEIINLVGVFGAKHNTLTKDISNTGLLFENKEQIPIGTKLTLVLSLSGLPPKLINLKGEVVRIEKLLSSGIYDVGVSFLEMTPSVKEEINKRIERMDILKLLKRASQEQASDLHLTSNSPPMLRVFGKIRPIKLDEEPLLSGEIKQMVYSILSEVQKQKFENEKDLNFVFTLGTDLRYRVSVYQQRGNVEVVFRVIPSKIESREELGLPPVIDDLCKLTDGIVIIAGTTGSGKTTTISAMIDIINRTKGGVIISLEKPIEYIHTNVKGIVKQREVGFDVPSFAAGLIAGLKQDPDVIMVGEVVDPDTIETALNAAETGHLVISSIHAADTMQVLDRIISLFPVEQQIFIASRLSHCLKAIITQVLLPHKNGLERVLVTEVCVANYAVKRIIHDKNFIQLNSTIQSNAKLGMHLLQTSIDKIYEQDLISGETYEMYSKKR